MYVILLFNYMDNNVFLLLICSIRLHDYTNFYSIKLPFVVESLLPTHFNTSLPIHSNILPPTHSNTLLPTCSSLLNSPPTRKRLWLQYMIASVGELDQVPYENQPRGPILDIPCLMKERGDMSDEEKRNVIFNMQCLLYSDPKIRLKWTLFSLKKDKESLKDSRVIERMELLRSCLPLLSSLSYCCDHNESSKIRGEEEKEKEAKKGEEIVTMEKKKNKERLENREGESERQMKKRKRDTSRINGNITKTKDTNDTSLLYHDIQSIIGSYLFPSSTCKSHSNNLPVLPTILECLRELIMTCDSCNLIGWLHFNEWMNELLMKDNYCIRLLKENNDR